MNPSLLWNDIIADNNNDFMIILIPIMILPLMIILMMITMMMI